MPTHLQAPWLSALAAAPATSVRVVVESGITRERRRLGWTDPDYGEAALETGIDPARTMELIRTAGQEAVHVFSGIEAYPGVGSAFRACVRNQCRIGIMAEASPSSGLSGFFRHLAGVRRRVQLERHIQFLLCIGDATAKFTREGYPPRKLFDFAYFPPSPAARLADDNFAEQIWTGDSVRLIFIGQLIHRKGVDRMLRALARMNVSSWQLAILGTGESEASLRKLCARGGLAERVRFHGAIPHERAMGMLAGADALLLPSRFDGYGAVVNEALQRGVPVICSDRCGARHMVARAPHLGSVFDSSESLRIALELWIGKGRRTPASEARITESAASLSPESGADYFRRVIRHVYGAEPRPHPPWTVLPVAQF